MTQKCLNSSNLASSRIGCVVVDSVAIAVVGIDGDVVVDHVEPVVAVVAVVAVADDVRCRHNR
eukprot:3708579-Amphidinium_carterae.1